MDGKTLANDVRECIALLRVKIARHQNGPSLGKSYAQQRAVTRKYESALKQLSLAVLAIESAERV